MASEKITVYNLADLKNTSDDALPNYLNSLKIKQSHHLTDVRLALGYSAVLVAAACFGWDYKFGFENTKYYSAAAVALYSILNGALTLWIWLKEGGTVYVGTAPNGDTITISTSTKKNVPIYNMTITVTPRKSSKGTTITLARSFTEWFDGAGQFIALPFQTMLATSVPLIGQLDPKRANPTPVTPGPSTVSPPAVEPVDQKYSADMLDMLAASAPTAEVASGTDSVSKKGGKRRKA